MKNTQINRRIIQRVATGLGELNDQVIYVGGAVVSLYVNDPAAEDVRPTMDIDISVSLASVGALEMLRQKLVDRGFVQSSEDDIICRFRFEDILVDVMNTQFIGWAPANPWFSSGFHARIPIDIEENRIYIMPFPYFLAYKVSAFLDRGYREPRTSKDLEDMVYLMDNRTDIEEVIATSTDEVKPFLIEHLTNLMCDPAQREAVQAHLNPEGRDTRFQRLSNIISALGQA